MKKIVSLIVCLCLFVSILPIVGTAAGVSLSIVRITMTEPKVGGEKPMDAKVPETARSIVTNVTWEGNFDANGCFLEGNRYTVFVEVGLKDAASEFNKKLSTLTLNGNNATLYSMELDKKSIVVCYTYDFPGPVTLEGFTDVAPDSWYRDAVKWAIDRGITTGTSETTFSPDNTCTRAQILTFMWRAVGSPKVSSGNHFDDVKESDYYYDAARWAYEKGMVTGSKFEGDTPCTRSATVVYLWKNAGSPYTSYHGTFADVTAGSDFASAVAWAVENGVTSGTSETTFSPDMTCTRGQIVTFLKRALR